MLNCYCVCVIYCGIIYVDLYGVLIVCEVGFLDIYYLLCGDVNMCWFVKLGVMLVCLFRG